MSWVCLLLFLMARLGLSQEVPSTLAVLDGRQLPRLRGAAVTQITAVVSRGGAVVPAHVQIDQRYAGPHGAWHYAFEAGADPHRAGRDTFGGADLLLLAVQEGGERMAAPSGSTEVEIVSMDGTTRWFYLLPVRGAGGAPEPPPLVRYDSNEEAVGGSDYTLGFRRGGTAVIDRLVIGRGVNLLDRSKARLDVDLALGMGHVHRTEDDTRVRVTGLHVGPLRIIREVEVRGRLLLGLYSQPVRDNMIFYGDGFVLPVRIRLTPTVRALIRAVQVRISMDLRETARGMTFQSAPDLTTPTVIDGTGGRHDGRRPIAWYLLRGRDSGLLGWIDARRDVAREVRLYYRDDAAHDDPPESVAGEYGDHGFLFEHHGRLPDGDVSLESHAWILRGAALDDPPTALRSLSTPPTVRVH